MDIEKKVKAKIFCTNKFEFEGRKFVKLQGILEGLGLFEQTVREELIPDVLEGKQVEMVYSIGIAKFKPFLRLVSISMLKGDNK